MDVNELERRAHLFADEYGGIIPYVEAFYIHSIIYSASRCLDSFARFDSLKAERGSAEELVNIVQEAVGHAAALSRYFWPSMQGTGKKRPNLGELKARRCEKLRKAFRLDESSALFNRDLRNAWEHFDERLDAYVLENNVGYFFPDCVLGSHSRADDPAGHIFKLLDVDAECLVLLGVKYSFTPIRYSVQAVLKMAVGMDANGARLEAR